MPSILKVRPRSSQEIEKIAHEIVKNHQPDAVKFTVSFDVEDFFEFALEDKTGIEAIFKWLPAGLDGYTDSVNMRCYVATQLLEYGDCQVTKRRLRATIAHEIGHCFLHVEEARRNQSFQQKFLNNKSSSIQMYQPQDVEVYKNPEWQAWRFASAMLMPENCFRTAVERNFSKKQLRRAFDVNQAFIDVRLKELKITKNIRNG
jgi:hypothetical protein